MVTIPPVYLIKMQIQSKNCNSNHSGCPNVNIVVRNQIHDKDAMSDSRTGMACTITVITLILIMCWPLWTLPLIHAPVGKEHKSATSASQLATRGNFAVVHLQCKRFRSHNSKALRSHTIVTTATQARQVHYHDLNAQDLYEYLSQMSPRCNFSLWRCWLAPLCCACSVRPLDRDPYARCTTADLITTHDFVPSSLNSLLNRDTNRTESHSEA